MHISLILVILLLLPAAPAATGESASELFFSGFGDDGRAHMRLTGDAAIQRDGTLRLTNGTPRVLGHAFYSRPFRLKNTTTGKALSFSTAFAFAMVPEYPKLGGHGLAFALSPSSSLPGSLPSQYLGLFNSNNEGNSSNNVVAVEFDTVQDFEFNDINDNHVGIDIDGLHSNASAPASYFDTETGEWRNMSLKSGKVIQGWIEYDSVETRLTVKLSPGSTEPNSSVLALDVDLSPYLEDSMFVGFSSSTGLLASTHYVLGWSFKIEGKARSLDLKSLPSVPKPKETHTTIALVATLSSILALIILSAGLFYVVRKIKNADVIESWELDIGPHRFSYDELKRATRGFREKQLIGFGGFGKVYRGTLKDSNTEVAVKRISHESRQGLREFVSEISSIGRLRHRNLVQLQGWCRRRGDLLLVYDFMANGSLDKYLFEDPIRVLSWAERFKIMKGVAYGLLYLHEEWEHTVIHRDVKAANVLLDSEMNGRLGDFGLAKLYEHGSNPNTTRVVGTLGYLAPELTRTGKPTTGSDVFAFGGLLLEVVCGRRPVEPKATPEEIILVDWVWDRWKDGAVLDVVDPKLGTVFDEAEVMLAVKLGLMCSNNGPEARPNMRQVVRFLDGEMALPDEVIPPDGYTGKKGNDSGGFDDFVHSYPSSSIFERASTFSSAIDDGCDDVEICSTSPLTILR